MGKFKMRSKENIIGEIHVDEQNLYPWDIALPFLEVLIDIRDILKENKKNTVIALNDIRNTIG